jgi:polyisoprenoid-binding protein YceI
MKLQHRTLPGLVLVAAFAVATPPCEASDPGGWVPVEVRGGTAAFDTDTSIPAISVHGRSTALQGKGRVRDAPDGLALEALDATLPVESLETGMGLRDEHMRRYIFTTADGKTPDLHFKADTAACKPAGAGQATCTLSGPMEIRGTERPFSIDLKVSKTGESFRAAGDATLKLSTWGIERPSQFGVRTDDDVRLHLEFVARRAPQTTAENRGPR